MILNEHLIIYLLLIRRNKMTDTFEPKKKTDWIKEFTYYPKLDIYFDKDRNVIINATVPGLTNDDVKVEWVEDYLVISYHKQLTNIIYHPNEVHETKYYLQEIHKSNFKRCVSIPKLEWEVDKMKAKVENGLLTVIIPPRDKEKITCMVE